MGFSKSWRFQNPNFFQKVDFFKKLTFSKSRLFQNPAISKSKVKSITLITRTSFEIDKPFKSPVEKETYDFLVEQNSALVKNGLSNNTKYKKRVGT